MLDEVIKNQNGGGGKPSANAAGTGGLGGIGGGGNACLGKAPVTPNKQANILFSNYNINISRKKLYKISLLLPGGGGKFCHGGRGGILGAAGAPGNGGCAGKICKIVRNIRCVI